MRTFLATAMLSLVTSVSGGADRIKVLIVDGVNSHDWEMTTEATKATLDQTGRFRVDVSTSPRKRAPKEEWDAYRPTFSDYQVVIGNFNNDREEHDDCGPLWSPKTMADFERFVGEGGGFVLIHGADNSWADWPAYNEMIGLGGWGGREAGKSGYLLRLIDGKWQPTSPNKGLSGEHGREREFLVVHDKPSHPILKGLPTEWMHAKDELYSALRGPAKNIEVLAHSFSQYTKEDEPTLFLITYGKGKVFHIPLGHDGPDGGPLHCVGYQTVLARAAEYVATGKVTLGIPDSFPTKEEAVVIAPDKVKWPGRPSLRGEITGSRIAFTKQVEVFGLHIYATNTTADDKLLHAANVLAEYIDNDEDGVPDNPKIMKALIAGRGAIVMRKAERERTTGPRPRGQGLYDEETIPNARAQGRFDASLEEILHMVTDVGWGGAYPEVFHREPGTAISNALDKARGGRFMKTPEHYPDDAWFTYDDETCDYDCMNSEYIYWVLTSILGAQDYPGRYEQIKREWRLNTRDKVKEGDPAVYAILTNPEYKLPTVLPGGKYKAKSFTIQAHRP
jgi:hypothetical protein